MPARIRAAHAVTALAQPVGQARRAVIVGGTVVEGVMATVAVNCS